MENISNKQRKSPRAFFYARQKYRNKVYQKIISFFAKRAQDDGLTKTDLAEIMGKDRAQITRWMNEPGNWTMDTVCDLLEAMDAEPDFGIIDKKASMHTNDKPLFTSQNKTGSTHMSSSVPEYLQTSLA